MDVNEILRLARWGLRRATTGKMTREELLVVFATIDSKASDSLRRLERNGAPTQPPPDNYRPTLNGSEESE